jgi:hypothetical protein
LLSSTHSYHDINICYYNDDDDDDDDDALNNYLCTLVIMFIMYFKRGRTPLLVACERDYIAVVKLLVGEYKANMNHQDEVM